MVTKSGIKKEDNMEMGNRKIILVTGFEPFGGEELNPTALVIEKLPDRISGYQICKRLLPVEFMKARELVIAEYDRVSPAAVIMLGQAGRRDAITPETTAVNVMNAISSGKHLPDNAGFTPDHLPLVEGGPDSLHATLPIDKMVEAIKDAGIPCKVSNDAGKYVCNAVLYGMLDHNKGKVPTGFIHVPYIKEQGHAQYPYMELDDICTGIVKGIEAVVEELCRRYSG